MKLINEQEFSRLSQFTNEVCISIFIPTQRAGKEVLEGKNQRHLKSLWKEAKTHMEEQGVSKEKIDKMAKPVVDLIDEKEFWRHQSDGLAVFVSEGFFEKFTLPINFEPYHYISKDFYLKPLAPVFNGDGRFYLLALQADHVAFYEATRYSIGKVEVDDLIPSQLEDRVGYDYEEKNMKHKTQHNMGGVSTQHGYEPATRDRKNEFLRYFRAVDKGLDSILHEEKVPLVVACQDYLFPIYQEASSYKYLYEKCVPGNPSDYRNMLDLHAKALEQLEPYFNKEKDEKVKQFNEQSVEKSAVQITDIIPAIYEGKVDTLFLQSREDIFGTFDEENMKVEIHDKKTPDNTSLMNWAAKKVIEQKGSVFLIEAPFMPHKDSKMNALLRYTY